MAPWLGAYRGCRSSYEAQDGEEDFHIISAHKAARAERGLADDRT
jgi:hypothetical protein